MTFLATPRLAEWILRGGLVLSHCGYIAWMTLVIETPLMGWLWSHGDVGGLNLGESTAIMVQRAIAATMAVTLLLLLWRPWSVLLGLLFLFQLTWATAMSQRLEGFPIDLVAWQDTFLAPVIDWLPYLFPYLTEAARISLPLVLWRVVVALRADPASRGWSASAEGIARIGVATTFAAHGIEALAHYPSFIDMLIISFRNLGFPSLSENSATTLLTLIGTLDLVLALLVLTTRWPLIAGYMAFWGLTTAAARITTRDFELGWIDTAIRAAHFAIPLVLVVWWMKAPRPTLETPHISQDSA